MTIRDHDAPGGADPAGPPGAPPFTLRQLQIFLAVADAGSISAAAGRLWISQTAVSLAVTQLERTLGARLMVRRRAQGIQLTPTGRSVAPLCRAILAQAQSLYEEASGDGVVRGAVSVGCFSSLGPSLMPSLLQAFLSAHPEARLHFREDQLDRLAPDVVAGTLDLMLTYDIGVPPELERVPLASCRAGVMLPEDHWAAREPGPVDLRELAAEPFVSLDLPLAVQHVDSVFRAAGIGPQIRYRSQNFETVRSFVGRGLGWAITLQQPETDLTHEGLRVVVREVGFPALAPVRVVAAWSGAAPLSRAAQAFLDLARSRAEQEHEREQADADGPGS